MKRIFENEKELVYGRPISKLVLKPFSISMLKQIFRDHCPGYKDEGLLSLYMITGGVSKYVELIMDAGLAVNSWMVDHAL